MDRLGPSTHGGPATYPEIVVARRVHPDKSRESARMGRVPARSYREPVEFTARGGRWPAGPWRSETPAYARVTAALVSRLQDELGARSIRDLARDAGVGHATLSRLLAGKVVPDLATIAALEDALRADLWPSRATR